MRRLFAWLIPLALIAIGLLWPLVFSGGVRARPTSTTRWCSATTRPTTSSTTTADSTRWRRSPREFPVRQARHLPVLGRRQPEQPAGAPDAGDHLDPARRQVGVRIRCCGRTASGSGWPRSAIPTSTSTCGTQCSRSATRIDGVLDPGTTGADKTIRRSRSASADRDRRRCSSGTSSPRRGTTGFSGPTSTITLPGDVARRQCSVGFGVGAPCGGLTVSGDTVTLSAEHLAPAHPGHRARRASTCRPRRASSCRGHTPGTAFSASR